MEVVGENWSLWAAQKKGGCRARERELLSVIDITWCIPAQHCLSPVEIVFLLQ